ncbi:MAG TPA: hypothetical protein VM555_00430 [Tahibacter sp.]|nr:hypothetical protein [Tahibacter sp.]
MLASEFALKIGGFVPLVLLTVSTLFRVLRRGRRAADGFGEAHRHMGTTARRILARARHCLLIVAAAFVSTGAVAQSGNVTLRINLDGDSVEIIKSWRRAQGIDPPDAAADERVRRMLRTVELVEVATGGTGEPTSVATHAGTNCVAPACGY